MLCWNLPSDPKHRGLLQKNIAFFEGKKLFAGDFPAKLDKTNADMAQFTKRWTGNGLSNIKDTIAESLQRQISILYQSKVNLQGWSLKFIWVMAGQNVKKKYLMS